MVSQLQQMQGVNAGCGRRDELSELKRAQASRLKEMHMSHRAAAPERLELAKLQAEIASLRRELASRLDTPVDSAASAAAALSNEAEAAALRAEVDAAKAERAALSQAVVIASAGDSPAVDRGVQLALNATKKTRGMAASASAAVLPTPKPAARPESRNRPSPTRALPCPRRLVGYARWGQSFR